MDFFNSLNAHLSNWALRLASICLAALGIVVIYGVIMRYGFNDAPPYVEQVALLLVISVAMFGAAAGVHDAGHIGLDSVVKMLSAKAQFWCLVVVELLTITFAAVLLYGCEHMAASTRHDSIPTLGISEAWRYVPPMIAGVLIILFSVKHMLTLFTKKTPA
ncbi:TRAP transporter small permease [Rhodoferax sp. WC2427]|uniref:TRAP transporter small permease n=1 Tax=Rhodoferax sp. WC2427 TaxID=3234144 RepID=UPI0034666F9F